MVLRQEKSRIYTATHDQKIKKTACIQLFLWFCFLFYDVVFRDKLFVQDEMKGG